MDMQTCSDWPSIQTQPALHFQLAHKALHTHMCTNIHKNTHTVSPSVTSVTSASGLEKGWVDRWCNNAILWIRVIHVGHIGWYHCFYSVKHIEKSISSYASGITYDIQYIVCDSNLKRSVKMKWEKSDLPLKLWDSFHFFSRVEIFPLFPRFSHSSSSILPPVSS